MKLYRTMIGSLMALAVSHAASAGQTVSLNIEGTIAPQPCSFQLSGGSNLNFGSVSREMLDGSENFIGERSLNVECPSERLVAIQAVDNKPNATQTAGEFGLGVNGNNESYGSYSFGLNNAKINLDAQNKASVILTSLDNGNTWNSTIGSQGDYRLQTAPVMVGFSNANLAAPSAIKSAVIPMNVRMKLNKDSISSADSVKLSGSATFELVYL